MLEAYTITPARYAKGKMVIHAPSTDGYKTRAARLAEYVGGRYVGRSNGYVVSSSAAKRFEALFAEGLDANLWGDTLHMPHVPGVGEFITAVLGTDKWAVSQVRRGRVMEKYDRVLLPREYAALKAQFLLQSYL